MEAEIAHTMELDAATPDVRRGDGDVAPDLPLDAEVPLLVVRRLEIRRSVTMATSKAAPSCRTE